MAAVRTTLTVVRGDACLDAVVDLDPSHTVGQLAEVLGALLPGPDDQLSIDGQVMDPAEPLRETAVRTGAVVRLGPPAPAEDAAPRAWLDVVSGPDSGLSLPLPDGETLLAPEQLPGSGATGPVRLLAGPAGVVAELPYTEDPDAPPRPDGSLRVAGELREGPIALTAADLIEVGADLVTVSPPTHPEAAVATGPALDRLVTRPPRLRPAETVLTVAVPGAPTAPEPRKLAVLPLVLPVVLGVVMVLVTRNPLFLLFTLLSPLLALSTWWSDRKSGRGAAERAQATYEAALVIAGQDIASRAARETVARRHAQPDAAELRRTATTPGPRLWERRRADEDSLLLRLGTGPAWPETLRVTSTSGEPPAAPDLQDVPCGVPLREVGVLGLAGPAPTTRAAARWLVGQAAVLHSPRDLEVWLLCDPAAGDLEAEWGWLRWLPHAAPSGEPRCSSRVATDTDALAERIAELAAVVASRVKAAADVRGALAGRRLPDQLVVLDGARVLRGLPGMAAVLTDGPRVGVHVICLDEQERLLPEECQAVASYDTVGGLSLRRSGEPDQPSLRAELVTPEWAEQVARGLAPLRDATPDGGEGEVPTSARLLDVLGLQEPTAAAILARWGRTTSFVVGVGADGPVTLDLRRDGPHALVAGTTGAGKSELLQTLVASLAVGNRPDAMTFVLVDYKGGAAFKDCARLPHTVGVVTDLDGPLVERALASLSAELKGREQLLATAGAKDIEDYQRGSPAVPLPRLLIVIDEFASLVEELPDFVRGLVGIAQRGRSLGVHLVLATQRPSGVVSPEIRANTNLRIALRVTDASESMDVLEAPDAAAISQSTPGRALSRTGQTTPLLFQSARVGGRAAGAAVVDLAPIHAVALPWSRVGALPPPVPAVETEPDDDATDLHALVEALRGAFVESGLPAPRRPWLDPLPELVTLEAVRREAPTPAPAGTRREPLPVVVLGVEDVPLEQDRRPFVLDLEHGGHLLVAGSARAGRTTLLRTLAVSLAQTVGPSDAHLYVLDCGNGALLGLADLQHCGAVVTRAQPERADRLLSRLLEEVTRRQELLAARGFADVAEQRAATADPLPYLVLLLDRWEGFTAAFEEVDAGRLSETFLRLLREGPGAGLRVVVTGDRSLLVGKVSSAIENTLVLRLAERSDYGLAGLSPRQLPEQVPVGRAFRGNVGTQVQVAVLADGSGALEAEALAELVSSQTGRVGRRPFRIDVLPTSVSVQEALELGAAETGLPIGVGGDELRLLSFDVLRQGPGFTVAGPPRSGRSTALVQLATGLLAQGATVCLLTPRPSPLRDVTGAALHLEGTEPSPTALAEVLNAATGPVAVVVDDAELLRDAAIGDLLLQVLKDGRDKGHTVLLAGTTEELATLFRGLTTEALKSRSGLLLSPSNHLQGELFGLRLPRSATFTGPPGRGLLIRGGTAAPVVLVQIPG